MAISFSGQLDELLRTSIAELDIPERLHELAVRRYEHLGTSLCGGSRPDTGLDCEIYPQGSFRLGTVTQPIDSASDYDIDLVCRVNRTKVSTTQLELKNEVGREVITYCESNPEGLPEWEEGKRCWTLLYRTDPFHMDVLPAIPAEEGSVHSILLTDTEVRNWQHSNPIDYAKWFHDTMEREFIEARFRLAEILKSADVEDVPAWKVKTTLQRTVQALKRHRDIYFLAEPDLRPASIVITTLAALAYAGPGPLFEVLLDISAKMPRLVGKKNGSWFIANPVQSEENFADRWIGHPEKADAFFQWINHAHQDFQGYAKDRGIHKVLERVSKTLGEDPARKAATALGTAMMSARESGSLRMGDRTGTLQTATGRSVPEHTFHGDAFGDSA